MKVITAHNLTKRFGSFTAVDGISFEVEKGKYLVFSEPTARAKPPQCECFAD
jgi:ABC-type branched-subunit amino acid transport system ATPase component